MYNNMMTSPRATPRSCLRSPSSSARSIFPSISSALKFATVTGASLTTSVSQAHTYPPQPKSDYTNGSPPKVRLHEWLSTQSQTTRMAHHSQSQTTRMAQHTQSQTTRMAQHPPDSSIFIISPLLHSKMHQAVNFPHGTGNVAATSLITSASHAQHLVDGKRRREFGFGAGAGAGAGGASVGRRTRVLWCCGRVPFGVIPHGVLPVLTPSLLVLRPSRWHGARKEPGHGPW